jgi:hypothetical protein
MRRSNLAFCLAHTPHIAAQLEAASTADRKAMEDQIEGLSRKSLVLADRLFGILTAGRRQTVPPNSRSHAPANGRRLHVVEPR